MSAGTSEFFCLICLLLCSCTAQKIITADLGQDVILPCKVPNINNINDIAAVEWIRPDQGPDYVLLYRDGRFDPDNQHPSYQNRVDLQDKETKDGDVSLILKNVTTEDTGRYVCQVSKKGKTEPFSIINLKVYLSAQEIITAELGQDVILPCKVPNINNITAVGWIRPDQGPDYVLLYRDGHIHQYNQHPSYQNRVDLQDKDLKDGDFSLFLKNVTTEDTGRYLCEKGKIELISIINLVVLPSDHSWKIIVGVVVVVIILLMSAVVLCYRKMKTLEEIIKQLKGNNPDIIIQLQPEEQENEAQQDEVVEGNNPENINLLQPEEQENEAPENEQIEGNNPETINQLQQVKQENEALKNELEELKRGHLETINQLQQVKQENEDLKNELEELEISHSETSKLLQQEKQRNAKAESEKKTLQDQLEKLMRGHLETISKLQEEKQDLKNKLKKLKGNNPEINNPLQKKKQKNKAPKNEMDKLEPTAEDP